MDQERNYLMKVRWVGVLHVGQMYWGYVVRVLAALRVGDADEADGEGRCSLPLRCVLSDIVTGVPWPRSQTSLEKPGDVGDKYC